MVRCYIDRPEWRGEKMFMTKKEMTGEKKNNRSNATLEKVRDLD